METESGAKIAIRGKGSVKEGKGRSDAAHTSNQEEDLHCLIMADTEDKVNKAKKAIHNVIETVSTPLISILFFHNDILTSSLRPPPFQKARTSSSDTSFVSLLHSTVLFVMMRIKLARTVVRLATANTTAHNSVILPPTSSVAFVATLDTWLAIVQSARRVPTGATTAPLLQADQLVVSAMVPLQMQNSTRLCRNSEVDHLVLLRVVSRLDPVEMQAVTTGELLSLIHI